MLFPTSSANGLDVAVKTAKDGVRVYPLAKKANPPEMEFVSGSGKSFNTVHANNVSFYEEINEVIQTDPTKGWNTIPRLYDPLESYYDQSWMPGDPAEVKQSNGTKPLRGSK